MNCMYCGGDTQVNNSRLQKRSNSVWRRRQCKECEAIFTTHETAELARSLAFIAKDGSIHPFIGEKLFLSLYESLKHKESALEDASALLNTILGKLLPQVQAGTLNRIEVITITTSVLKNFDAAAAVSYQAFHPI